MTLRSSQCSPKMARAFVKALVGDGDITVGGNPHDLSGGTPVYSYFATMDLDSAHEAYEEIHQLPKGQRLPDLMERLGMDGRVA